MVEMTRGRYLAAMTETPHEHPDSLEDQDGDDATPGSDEECLAGRRLALVGRLGGMNRREAANLIRSYGGSVVDRDSDHVDWIVIGAEELPLAERDLIPDTTRRMAAEGNVEIIHETELWGRLGLVTAEQSVRSLHTPAMLAHLLGVSVRVIRRWHRRGLIQPIRTLHRLPYFDFREVATARRLAQWVASGASPEAIERRLMELIAFRPNLRRPLDQLSILVEGRHVLLRQGEGLIEPGGQLRFDFDAMDGASSEEPARHAEEEEAHILTITAPDEHAVFPSPTETPEDGLLAAAYDAEDEDALDVAIDYYHAVLARDGTRADIHFQIAELLYRSNELVAARERYYAAIEVDPDHVEARASLAGVLAELGQPELAVAAYQGALALHPDYADVHFALARLLDGLDRDAEAEPHWRQFLTLAPRHPFAEEARKRLEGD
ncbi:MAG: MerR family DNA-binding transcriptional regulator [Planctomycetota bacterium]